jgi:sulfopropanediol 3-dehydrogenase
VSEYLKKPPHVPGDDGEAVRAVVSEIISAVEREGEAAVRRYSDKFDGWAPRTFRVGEARIKAAEQYLDPYLREQIDYAAEQIRAFAGAQRSTLTDLEVAPHDGVVLGHRHIPIDAVGSYSPGGRYPLIASSLMTVITPKVAGVDRVVAVAPPRRSAGIHPPQLYAMASCGADEIFCVGGVQALAALVFGLEGSEPVDMIVGAGNAYIAEAKRQLFGRVGIDLLAGPSEITVIADEHADPRLVAADLLGQAEHGPNSPAVLITTSEDFGRTVVTEVERWLTTWPTADIAGAAWRDFGAVIVCADQDEAIAVSNGIAPEHLEIQTARDDYYAARLRNYGSLFVGPYSTVAYSDKAIGTNHVLPTMGAGRYTGGLWVGKFLKTLTYQRVSRNGTAHVAEATAVISDAELMAGHALTARLRTQLLSTGADRLPADSGADGLPAESAADRRAADSGVV